MRCGSAERVDHARIWGREFVVFAKPRGEGIHVDSARETWTVAEQDSDPQRRIMFVIVVGSAEAFKCLRVDSILNVRPSDSKENDWTAPFDGQLDAWPERDILEGGRFALFLRLRHGW